MSPAEEQLAFYYEIGLTLTQWANIERVLMDIAGSCINKQDYNKVGHGYFAIENFRSKLAFVDTLVTLKCAKNTRLMTEWASLQIATNNLSHKRNKLAHHRVMHFTESPPGKRSTLIPWIDKSATKKSPASGKAPSHSLGVKDIVLIRHEIFRLYGKLDNFSCKLARRKVHFPKSFGQELSPPTNASVVALMRSVFQAPPPPSQE